jgi:hypothetical protein
MTSPESRRNRAHPIHIELQRQEAGTLLGALAWVMGAIQIMRDRAHAEGEHGGTEYDQIYQELQPRLERIVERIAKSRMESVTQPEFAAPSRSGSDSPRSTRSALLWPRTWRTATRSTWVMTTTNPTVTDRHTHEDTHRDTGER